MPVGLPQYAMLLDDLFVVFLQLEFRTAQMEYEELELKQAELKQRYDNCCCMHVLGESIV